VKIRYLLDENISPKLKTVLLRLSAEMDVLRIGEADAPSFGTPDPDVLRYSEMSRRLLVTFNRKSMPEHIEAFLSGGGQLFGLLWVRQGTPIRILAEELFMIWEVSEAEEWIGMTEWIPF